MKQRLRNILSLCLSILIVVSGAVPSLAAGNIEEEEYLGTLQDLGIETSIATYNVVGNPVEDEEYLGNIEDLNMEVIMSEYPQTRSSTSFGGAIAVGSSVRSPSTYYMSKGDTYSYTVAWAPTGQSIKICRVNVNTGAVYCSSKKTGGSASGTVSTSSEAGEYYFAVYNVGTKRITSCTCNIGF